ncbi:unnamed protein product, partial [marine sediment metagenome]
FLAETPINRYNGDFKLDLYEPGDDVTASSASEFWLTSKDVSGVRLTTTPESQYGTYTADFDGDEITSYFDGLPVQFPFDIDVTFRISTGAIAGFYRAKDISGTVGQTATVIKAVRGEADLAIGALDNKLNLQPGYKPPISEPDYWDDGDAPTFTPSLGVAVEWEATRGGENWEGPFVLCAESERTDSFEIDFKFVQGLAKRDSEGSLVNHTVVVQLAWRDFGQTSWNYEPEYSWTNNTLD